MLDQYNGRGMTYEGLLTTSSIPLAQKYYELLTDEPTSSLDESMNEKILNIFEELKKRNVIVVIVSHDMELAKSFDKVIRISTGEIAYLE